MKAAVERWLEFAGIDLKAAGALMREASLAPVVCFHVQQSVEKCLKAIIESKGLNPPKSHDLIMLYGQVDDMIKLDEDILARLNQVYIDTRYPASLGSLPEGPPDIDDAKDLNEFARAVYAQAMAILQAE